MTTDRPTIAEVEGPSEPLLAFDYPHTLDGEPDETNERYHVAPTLPIGFVPTTRLVEMLQEKGFTHPYLLLTVRRERKRKGVGDTTYHVWDIVSRRLEPLEDQLTYLTFQSAGKHQILATVINVPDNDMLDYVSDWVDDPKGYKLHEPTSNAIRTECFNESRYVVHFIETDFAQTVDVDEELFAKEPPELVQKFVGQFFKSRPKDQCKTRGRLIVSILAALASLPVWPFRAALMLLVLALGCRNINWKLLNPIEWHDGDPLRSYKDHKSIWWFRKVVNKETDNATYKKRSPVFVVINPVVLVYAPVLTWWVSTWFTDWSFWLAVSVWFAFVLIACITLGVLTVVAVLWDMFWTWLQKSHSKPREPQEDLEAQKQRDLFAKLALLAQTGPVSNVDQLPEDAQTLRLRYLALKDKVCKVYQR